MTDEQKGDNGLLEILALIAVIVLMRGCYHAGVVAEKLSPESYPGEPHSVPDPDPTMNGLYPLGSPFIGN